MRRHIRGIDHVVILVRDLDRARDTWTRLGFTLTPRGYHTLGSQNHCIVFERDYLELLAVPKPHPAMQYFTDFLVGGEGLGAIAFATGDANAAQAELAAAGVAADPPLDFSARSTFRAAPATPHFASSSSRRATRPAAAPSCASISTRTSCGAASTRITRWARSGLRRSA
jgi:catechol 2,3-dioxygenase-like lactoylglutathione lyase family enzyme